MDTMHIFAGAGGGLLADLILGHNPIVAVEWDKYACQILRERAADGWFPSLHVWEGDVRLFDPSEYKGRVDCIHAGFPCQDLSVAGKQSGLGEGTRSGLYREVLRIAGVVQPRFLFLENVSAILSNGLEHVLADLAALGYDCRWTCLRASECGANHHRDRWWLLADSNGNEWRTSGLEQVSRTDGRNNAVGVREVFPDTISERPSTGTENEAWTALCNEHRNSQEDERGWFELESRIGSGGEILANAMRQRQQRIIPGESSSQGRKEPSQRQDRSCSDGIGWWTTEPDVGRVANGVAHRVDRLKALGNGQVPLQAATAWCLLGGPISRGHGE